MYNELYHTITNSFDMSGQIKFDKKGEPIRPNTTRMPAWARDAAIANWKKEMEKYERANPLSQNKYDQTNFEEPSANAPELEAIRQRVLENALDLVKTDNSQINAKKLQNSINRATYDRLEPVAAAISNGAGALFDAYCKYFGVCFYVYCRQPDCSRPHIHTLRNQKTCAEIVDKLSGIDGILATEPDKSKLILRITKTPAMKLAFVIRALDDYIKKQNPDTLLNLVEKLQLNGLICRYSACYKKQCEYPQCALKQKIPRKNRQDGQDGSDDGAAAEQDKLDSAKSLDEAENKAENKAEPEPQPEPQPEAIDEAKQEPKYESKQEPKEEPKQEPKQEPKDEPKEEPKQEPKDEPKQEPKEEPKEEPKQEPKEEPKQEPKDEPKQEPKDEPKEEPKQEPKDEPKDEPKKKSKSKPKPKPKSEPKNKSKQEKPNPEINNDEFA